jgi:hypothetical protein
MLHVCSSLHSGHPLTSTNSNYYTGLKLRSKMHFYGRVAAEEVLATFLSALLRPRSGRRGFSDLSKRTFTAAARPKWL